MNKTHIRRHVILSDKCILEQKIADVTIKPTKKSVE